MKEPEYQRPFEQKDFRGYFRWPAKLTSDLGSFLYHACHKDELKEILDADKLILTSKWFLKLPRHGLWSAPGIWTGLNYFNRGNYYGPFLINLPLKLLNGRHFMVFRRTGNSRYRYFFVQYEARIPIYSFGSDLWRKVDPYSYFQRVGSGLNLKRGGIYDIVLTEPAELIEIKIEAVEHPRCIYQKCKGMSRDDGKKALREIALGEFYYWLSKNREYAAILKKFSILNGAKVILLKF